MVYNISVYNISVYNISVYNSVYNMTLMLCSLGFAVSNVDDFDNLSRYVAASRALLRLY